MHGAVLDHETIRALITNPPAGQPPLVEDLLSLDDQLQPTGFDFTLRRVDRLTSAGRIGRVAADRSLPESETLAFDPEGWLFLDAGPYLVTFNEVVNIPLNLVALACPRSSLGRSGVSLHTAVWDAGYRGRSQALLTVYNPAGYHVQQDARLMQMVFFQLTRPVQQGYQGRYQGERP